MATLYADEDFSYPVVQRLRQLGHDILTAYGAGQAGQGITDEEVLALARAAGRAVLTFNRRHFIRLHLRVSLHAGIIACTCDDDVTALANRIPHQLQRAPTLQGQLLPSATLSYPPCQAADYITTLCLSAGHGSYRRRR